MTEVISLLHRARARLGIDGLGLMSTIELRREIDTFFAKYEAESEKYKRICPASGRICDYYEEET